MFLQSAGQSLFQLVIKLYKRLTVMLTINLAFGGCAIMLAIAK